jgi:hypothetical protein
MNKAISLAITTLSSMLLVAGCSNNPTAINDGAQDYTLVASYENNSGEEIAKDVARLAESFSYSKLSLGTAKKQSSSDIQWQVWTYTNGWWIRSGKVEITTDLGTFDIEGQDSVKFLDISTQAIKNPLLSDVKSGDIRSHGSFYVDNSDGGFVKGSRDYNFSGTITNETTLTLNGNLIQSFNAQDASNLNKCFLQGNASASNIVFTKELLGWSKPVSGTVTVVSNFKTISVVFDNGTAHVKVTAKDGTTVKDVTISL